MPSLEPIPIPARLRWREFKIRILPLLVFSTVAVLAVMVWRNQMGPRGLVGQVELIETKIGSPRPVVVSAILVKPNQFVRAGDPVARVVPANAAQLAATLEVIRAEAAALKGSFQALRPQNQMLVDYERLRLESLDFKAQLAVAKVEAELAESEVLRGRALAKVNIMAAEELDRLESLAKARRVQVEELTVIAAAGAAAVADTQAIRSDINAGSAAQALGSAVDVQEKKLRLVQAELGESLLTAQIDGEVGTIFHQTGDAVATGDPILTVAATKPAQIVAYMRQPVLNEPKPGMKVQVRARSQGRPMMESSIASVASRLEPINPLLYPNANINVRAPELALAIRIAVPPGLEVRPGETVDVILEGAE
jgi:membrane fusion protein, multidrug efflux system